MVHLDVPENIMNGKEKADVASGRRTSFVDTHASCPTLIRWTQAADMLATADLPIIHAGSGVIHAAAYDELRRSPTLLHAPVTTSGSAVARSPRRIRALLADGAHEAQHRGPKRRRPGPVPGITPR